MILLAAGSLFLALFCLIKPLKFLQHYFEEICGVIRIFAKDKVVIFYPAILCAV